MSLTRTAVADLWPQSAASDAALATWTVDAEHVADEAAGARMYNDLEE